MAIIAPFVTVDVDENQVDVGQIPFPSGVQDVDSSNVEDAILELDQELTVVENEVIGFNNMISLSGYFENTLV